MIKAALFDMDGLLIDSEPFWVEVMKEVFLTVGLPLSTEECTQTTGLRFDQVVQYWYSQCPWGIKSPEMVFEEVLLGMEQVILLKAPLKPGVHEILSHCKEKGLKTAIVSSSALKLVRACQTRIHFHTFNELVSAESEEYGKPHPAVFLTAAKKLDCHPLECIVFEDSFNGVLAAKAARMYCVAVPEIHNSSKNWVAIADCVINSLMDFQSIPNISNG